jgi:hypothetical protein
MDFLLMEANLVYLLTFCLKLAIDTLVGLLYTSATNCR